MNRKIYVYGSTCVDVIITLDHLPRTEEDMHPFGQSFRMGGCAYNVANILGKAGGDVTFVTPLGMQGLFGPFVASHFKEEPWACPVMLPDRENGCCYCLVEKDGERTFLSVHGAEYTFDPAWTGEVEADYLYVCGLEVEERTGEKLVSWLETGAHGRIFYAPGPRGMRVDPALTERLMRLKPILHLNEKEAMQMAGGDCPEAAAETLFARTGQSVIVTLGAKGAMAYGAEGLIRCPGEAADNVVDTIGAGDAHAGGMLYALARGDSMAQALRVAGAISKRVVEVPGSTLTLSQLREALESAQTKP